MADPAIEKMTAATAQIQAAEDNLLMAIATIAAARQITVMPSPTLFGQQDKPVILLPKRMFDRMKAIIPQEDPAHG